MFDGITLEILWRRLITIMDEVDAAVVRTSFSTIVGESRDFACIMLDAQGRSIAQSQLSSTAFTVTLPRTAKAMLRAFPPETLAEGDVLLTNDPWIGSGHLPDLNVLTPVFHRGCLVAFIGAVAHVSDVGGRIDYFDSRDLFEEGLRLMPCKAFEGGRPNPLVHQIIGANSRAPDLVIGDLFALAGAEVMGVAKLKEMLEDYGMDDLDALGEAIRSSSEAAMREAISALPDGTYRGEVPADGYRRPVRIAVAVTIAGDTVTMDFAGSSPALPDCSVNCPYTTTFADSYYPLKCSLAPEIPNNEGLFAPLVVLAPEGSVLNVQFPTAVRARSKVSFHIHAAVYQALAEAMPDAVQAGSGSFWSFVAYGTDRSGRRFRAHYLPNGGKGAVAGMDGLPTIAFPYNGTATPSEILENAAPIVVWEKSLLADSGGPGQWRGGQGQRIVISPLRDESVEIFLRPDKVAHPAPGILGGRPGRPGRWVVAGKESVPPPFRLEPGERLEIEMPGGGGCGPPERRDRERVKTDVQEGRVTEQAAISSQDALGRSRQEAR
ncbi:MAG: hydantoinase B/oxoprolinase family protein [Armatimonadetes bacterium]|nr:hydantoinase B/oxoprolinase family protein [Armatimonadota bacterium]